MLINYKMPHIFGLPFKCVRIFKRWLVFKNQRLPQSRNNVHSNSVTVGIYFKSNIKARVKTFPRNTLINRRLTATDKI